MASVPDHCFFGIEVCLRQRRFRADVVKGVVSGREHPGTEMGIEEDFRDWRLHGEVAQDEALQPD